MDSLENLITVLSLIKFSTSTFFFIFPLFSNLKGNFQFSKAKENNEIFWNTFQNTWKRSCLQWFKGKRAKKVYKTDRTRVLWRYFEGIEGAQKLGKDYLKAELLHFVNRTAVQFSRSNDGNRSRYPTVENKMQWKTSTQKLNMTTGKF